MLFLRLGAISGFLAVAAGAFGAHALEARLAPDLVAVFETGVRYHLAHAVVLVALGLGAHRLRPGAARVAGWAFVAGTVVFAGSLYALALSGVRAWGAVTPLGGLAFLAGWLALAWSARGGLRQDRAALAAGLVVLALASSGCGDANGQGDRGARDSRAGDPAAPGPAAPGAPFATAGGVTLVPVVSGLHSPVHLAAPAGDPRLFVVEQGGAVRIVNGGRLLERPFLDLTARVRSGGERGLLSIAFHPRYPENGRFFVNFTDRNGDTRVEGFRVSAGDADRADPASGSLVLTVGQPYSNHNGGHVVFGPDGMLYVGMGDGGSANDPQDAGQRLDTLLGKLLRVDVDRRAPYAIPPDNPFAGPRGRRDARPEIWAWGLRNPWRFAFDAVDGLLYIADVGQNAWEEVHVEPAGRAGVNYGWNVLEASHPFRVRGRATEGLARPQVEYAHDQGCSITGGVVYRGRDVPALAGHYVFSDYCAGWLRSFRMADGRAVERRQWEGVAAGPVTSFGVDGRGEVYVLNARGEVLRLAPSGRAGSRPGRG